LIVGGVGAVELVRGKVYLGAYGANPACVGIDDAAANCDSGGEAEIGSGALAEVPC
jgi:hypothetical protein